MNVSLPQIAAHSMPAKTLPGAGKTSEKFSMAFADAQEATDPSTPQVGSDAEMRVSKKVSSKNDKNGAKSSALPADPTPTGTVKESPAISNVLLPSWSIAGEKESQLVDQDASALDAGTSKPGSLTAGLSFRAVTTASGVVPNLVAPKSTVDGAKPPVIPAHHDLTKTDAADANQSTAMSSTNLLSTWMTEGENTNSKSLAIPANANAKGRSGPSGSNAGTVAAETKPALREVARDTVPAIDTKVQAAITVPQPRPLSQDKSVSTKPNASSVQQEKAIARASAEPHKKDFDGAKEETSKFGKENAPSLQPPTGNRGPETFAAGTGSASAIHTSSSGVEGHVAGANAFPKAPVVPPHGRELTDAEDAAAATEATALNSPIHAAKLVAGIERSELRVGLRTGEFGNVDIRTSLARNQFTAEISVERGELGRALAAELPSLHHRLAEQHVAAANITVQDNSGGGAADFRQGSRESHKAPVVSPSDSDRREDSPLPMVALESVEPAARLDIHM